MPFRAAIRAERRVHHDGARAGAVARRGEAGDAVAAASSQALLRDELRFEGVILSDDLEMKAIAKTYTVPDAAVQAIAAGCDGLLICSGDVDVQAATLEALVHAVEQERIPYKRLEDALDAPASREGALPGRAGRSSAEPAGSGRCSAATRIGASPTRWRGTCEASCANLEP